MISKFMLDQYFVGHPVKMHSKKSVLFDHQDVAHELSYIVAGQVKISFIAESGQEYTLNTIGPGEAYPLPAYFMRKSFPIKYSAGTNVKVISRPRDEADEHLRSNPEVLYDLVGRILSVMYTRIITLSHGTSEEKVLHRLVELGERFGTKQNGLHEIIITQQEVADSVSLSRESVCMILNKLEAKQILEVKRNKIQINLQRAVAELSL